MTASKLAPARRDMTLWPIDPVLALPRMARLDVKAQARDLNVSGSTMHRYIVEGMSDWQADRVACRLGLHPGELWADWFTAGLSVLDELHLAGGWRQAWLYEEQATA